MKKPAAAKAKGKPSKRPATKTTRKEKAKVTKRQVSGDEDLAAATQHYSGTEGEPLATPPKKPKATPKKKASPKVKTQASRKSKKASPKVKASKVKGKGRNKTNTDLETPPAKRPRTSKAQGSVPKESRQEGKQTFARRRMAGKDPSKTFWQSLRTAFEKLVEPRVKSPSSLEERCRVYCFFLPWFTMILLILGLS